MRTASDEYDDAVAVSGPRKRSWDASAAAAAVKRPRETPRPAGGRPSDALCQCPLKCSERVPPRTRHELFKTFVEMGDEDVQNEFLQMFVEARPVADRLFSTETTADGKLLRRVRCKYRMPSVVSDDFMSCVIYDSDKDKELNFDETSSSVASMDSKEENDMALESDSTETSRKSLNGYNCVDVCQKAFLNLFGLSSKRIKILRELLIIKSRQKHIKRMMEIEENQIEVYLVKNRAQGCLPLIAPFNTEESKHLSDRLMTAISNDINLVDNFFYNQLWKPEYMNQKPSK